MTGPRTGPPPLEVVHVAYALWVDWDGQVCPTRPCPTCGRVIPIKRRAGASMNICAWCGRAIGLGMVLRGSVFHLTCAQKRVVVLR